MRGNKPVYNAWQVFVIAIYQSAIQATKNKRVSKTGQEYWLIGLV